MSYQFVDNEHSAKEFDKNFNWVDKKSTITRPMLFSLSNTKKRMSKNNNSSSSVSRLKFANCAPG